MKGRSVKLNVNGSDVELVVTDNETILDVVRGRLGLTGTKEGCGTGECGACTILVNGEAVLACLSLAVDMEGKRVVTIEGLAEGGQMTDLQKAFIDHGAVQCGFCSPGMILSATALLARNPAPSRKEIQKALEGNLCRCTGYNKIVAAVEKVGEGRR